MAARKLASFLVLLAGMLSCGWVAVYLGKELNWDLANYHFYNPYYFLQQRWNIDYWPSSFIHVNFTPTLDFLTFFLITTVTSKETVFIMGALHGINFWLLFCIARVLLPRSEKPYVTFLLALALAFLGLYGPTALPGIGSFQHDNLVSLFVLSFLYLQLVCLQRYINTQFFPKGLFFFSSVLLGLGVGGKLTTGIFVLASVFTFLILDLPWKQKVKMVVMFGAGVGVGVLLSSGYWMWFLWSKHHNPFFPLWNGLFKSPDFPLYNWRDARFLPKDWMEALLYPFYFSVDGRSSDTPFQDFRFAVVYLLFVCLGVDWTRQKIKSYRKREPFLVTIGRREIFYFFTFFVFSYVIWQCYFSIMRYIVVLEMLAPLCIYLLLYQLIADNVVRMATSVVIFMFILGMMVPTSMVRAPWYDTSYFNIKMPMLEPRGTVLMAFPAFAFNTNPRPQTYLIPFFPKDWRFIGIPFEREQYTLPSVLPALIKQKEKLYLLASPAYMPKLVSIASAMGFTKPKRCDVISSDRQLMTHENISFCAVTK